VPSGPEGGCGLGRFQLCERESDGCVNNKMMR
jgi:hypothetical protein